MRWTRARDEGTLRERKRGYARHRAVIRLWRISSVSGMFVPAASGFLPSLPASSLNGKEGVDGSSPSEGSAKDPQIGALSFGSAFVETRVRYGDAGGIDWWNRNTLVGSYRALTRVRRS
jgi:hypothetical protein